MFEATGDIDKAYATAPSYPVGTQRTFYLSGSSAGGTDGALVTEPGPGRRPAPAPTASVAPVGPNYTETSGLDQSRPVTDPPGTAIRFATAAADPRRWTSSARRG